MVWMNWKRLCSRRDRRRWLRMLTVLFALIAVGSIGLVGLRARAKPMAIPVFRNLAESCVEEIVQQTAEELLAQEEYSAICTLAYQGDGTIAGLAVDSRSANRLVAELTSALRQRLAHVPLTCQVQSGDILFPRLFSGGGIRFSVRGSVYGSAMAKLVSNLAEGGLNQTMHRLEIEVNVPVTLTVLGESEERVITTRILLCESVIVGGLPGGVVVG